MNKTQEHLKMAAEQLGLKIDVPYTVIVSIGNEINCQARLPELGHLLGTLIFDWNDEVVDRSALLKQGYSISTFSVPSSGEIFKIEDYIEMSSDWGWNGLEEDKPLWMF